MSSIVRISAANHSIRDWAAFKGSVSKKTSGDGPLDEATSPSPHQNTIPKRHGLQETKYQSNHNRETSTAGKELSTTHSPEPARVINNESPLISLGLDSPSSRGRIHHNAWQSRLQYRLKPFLRRDVKCTRSPCCKISVTTAITSRISKPISHYSSVWFGYKASQRGAVLHSGEFKFEQFSALMCHVHTWHLSLLNDLTR